MALFCKSFAEKFGMVPDPLPLLCEGCGKEFQKRESIMKVIYKKLKSK